ncbi:hypothetical protein BGZ63DRAFT_376454 [Mariannaea sp. PMI_226]|nr:hypothetical protein BGZ63DRAFT_376454 [Mariannaea sp. PMI_226]
MRMARNKKGSSTRGAKTGRGGQGGRSSQATPRTLVHGIRGPELMSHAEDLASFTLADEARQTSQHDHTFQNSNLRQRPVVFVSAGVSEPLKLLDALLEANENNVPEAHDDTETPLDREASTEKESAWPSTLQRHDTGEAEDSKQQGLMDWKELERDTQDQDVIVMDQDPAEEHLTFCFDLQGDLSQAPSSKRSINIPDRPSSRSSSSSEEVILFKGRDALRKAQDAAVDIDMAQIRTEIQVVEEEITAGPSLLPTRGTKGTKMQTKSRRQTRRRNTQYEASDEDEAIIADYIANMRANGDADHFLAGLSGNTRDLGGMDYYVPDDSDTEEGSDGPDDDTNHSDGLESDINDATLEQLIAGHNRAAEKDADPIDSRDSTPSSNVKVPSTPFGVEEFDYMDWERPSLRRKKKGKGAQAQINFNVSDSEMEQALQAAWKNDRLKKSERKKQREQLRALGMLGKKTNPEDMSIRYPNGLSMEQMSDEFRLFLMGTDETVIFPPMDKHARKMIHELATAFKIKSKSTGKSEHRRPTLIRTLRTVPYVQSTFNQAVNRFSRRYFPRLDVKGKGSQRPQPPRGNQAATYRDGEIIGAAAPELGIENRGRAMLEKMGWSSGTALGAIDNKGILQPVIQTMKRSKAGLG